MDASAAQCVKNVCEGGGGGGVNTRKKAKDFPSSLRSAYLSRESKNRLLVFTAGVFDADSGLISLYRDTKKHINHSLVGVRLNYRKPGPFAGCILYLKLHVHKLGNTAGREEARVQKSLTLCRLCRAL